MASGLRRGGKGRPGGRVAPQTRKGIAMWKGSLAYHSRDSSLGSAATYCKQRPDPANVDAKPSSVEPGRPERAARDPLPGAPEGPDPWRRATAI